LADQGFARNLDPLLRARQHDVVTTEAEGMGILKIGRTIGVATSVVQRVLQASA
jgi:hypothetical protein